MQSPYKPNAPKKNSKTSNDFKRHQKYELIKPKSNKIDTIKPVFKKVN